MKLALVFPPFFISYQPYSSLPTLGAYLREKGYLVGLLDENIEFINYCLTPSFFEKIYQETQGYLNQLMKSTTKTKNGLFLSKYIYNCFKKSYFDMVIKEIESSLKVLRDEMLISNEHKANKARDVLSKGQNLILQFIRFNQLVKKNSRDLVSGLKWHDIENELYTNNEYRDYFKKFTIQKILACAPDVIGISIAFEDQIIPAFILANELRKNHKLRNIHITLGGPVITILQDVIKKNKEMFSVVDSCVVYEGEYALVRLLENLKLNRSLDDIPNLIYLKDDYVVANEIKMITDLNSLPTPNFDGLPLDKYFSSSLVPVLKPTRGCYWNKCTFCNNKFLNNYSTYRVRNSELVFEDFINLYKKYNIKKFALWEEAAVPKCLKKLAELIANSNYNFKWFAEARFEKTFTESFLRSLYQGGCRAMVFGLESGNKRIQNLMNKGYDLEVCKNVIRNCRRANIRVYIAIMVGFPSETPQEVLDTINFLSENNRHIFHAGVSHFGLRKYTETYNKPKKFGIYIKNNVDSFSSTGDLSYVINNNGMTLEESIVFYNLFIQKLSNLGLTRNEPECHYLIRTN